MFECSASPGFAYQYQGCLDGVQTELPLRARGARPTTSSCRTMSERISALLGCRIAHLSDAARLSSDHSDGRFYSGGRPALFPLGRGGPERSNGTVSKSVSV